MASKAGDVCSKFLASWGSTLGGNKKTDMLYIQGNLAPTSILPQQLNPDLPEWFGCGPLTVTVTTRGIMFLDPYKPSFATVTVRGPHPRNDLEIKSLVDFLVASRLPMQFYLAPASTPQGWRHLDRLVFLLNHECEKLLVNNGNWCQWIMWVFPKNRGTPKSSILIGFSISFTIHFGGFSPYFWKHTCLFRFLSSSRFNKWTIYCTFPYLFLNGRFFLSTMCATSTLIGRQNPTSLWEWFWAWSVEIWSQVFGFDFCGLPFFYSFFVLNQLNQVDALCGFGFGGFIFW